MYTKKNYIQKQWSKILTGHVNFKDFAFAKEVRLGGYVSVPPAALVALNKMTIDPMAAPKHRERVKYIVIAGKEGSRVKDLVVSPEVFIKSHNHKLHGRYYIENVINSALGRLFASFNIDLSVLSYLNTNLLHYRIGTITCLKASTSIPYSSTTSITW